MEKLTNFNQLEIGEQYRLLITYKGNNYSEKIEGPHCIFNVVDPL